MRSAPAGTVKVMKPEEKQRAVGQFIGDALAQDATVSIPARVVTVTLIAHSPSSPAAQALAAVSAGDATITMHTRAIFATLDVAAPADAAWLVAPNGRVVLREITDARLCDAHEQLVLDGTATWIGDCLRRDPSKRDAYETFAKTDATTRRFAELSFERIWARAKPVQPAHSLACAPDEAISGSDPSAVELAPLPIDFAATAMIATRH